MTPDDDDNSGFIGLIGYSLFQAAGTLCTVSAAVAALAFQSWIAPWLLLGGAILSGIEFFEERGSFAGYDHATAATFHYMKDRFLLLGLAAGAVFAPALATSYLLSDYARPAAIGLWGAYTAWGFGHSYLVTPDMPPVANFLATSLEKRDRISTLALLCLLPG
jgi:hypothetical protein